MAVIKMVLTLENDALRLVYISKLLLPGTPLDTIVMPRYIRIFSGDSTVPLIVKSD